MILYTRVHEVDLSFRVAEHEKAETVVWKAIDRADKSVYYFETPADPTEAMLVGSLKDAYLEELTFKHSQIVRGELDEGIV